MATIIERLEDLIGSQWEFNQSTSEIVEVKRIDKALSKLTGRVITLKYINRDREDFRTNEAYFKKDFLIWAKRIK